MKKNLFFGLFNLASQNFFTGSQSHNKVEKYHIVTYRTAVIAFYHQLVIAKIFSAIARVIFINKNGKKKQARQSAMDRSNIGYS